MVETIRAELSIAIAHFRTQKALATYLKVKQPTVSEWLRGERPIPDRQCAEMEWATRGKVRCERLNPDLKWFRVPDEEWTWHRGGAPAIWVAPSKKGRRRIQPLAPNLSKAHLKAPRQTAPVGAALDG